MKRKPWTKTENSKLRREYPHRQTRLIAVDLGRTPRAVYQRALNLGLRKSAEYLASETSGRLRRGMGSAYRFRKGNVPWNKDQHWIAGGRSAQTRYKPGNISGRAAELVQPVGTFRITKDGYLEQKFSTAPGNPNKRWRSYHRLVWEAANGPMPPGHAIVFRPGRMTTDRVLITLDALELVSRGELMRRNSYHTKYPKAIGQLIQLRGAVQRQINKRERDAKQDRRSA